MAKKRRAAPPPMYNPNVEYVTNLTPQGETPLESAQKHLKYIYWIQFIILILIVISLLYVYMKGVPVKVR
jgi:hypothetical protein